MYICAWKWTIITRRWAYFYSSLQFSCPRSLRVTSTRKTNGCYLPDAEFVSYSWFSDLFRLHFYAVVLFFFTKVTNVLIHQFLNVSNPTKKKNSTPLKGGKSLYFKHSIASLLATTPTPSSEVKQSDSSATISQSCNFITFNWKLKVLFKKNHLF